MISTCTRCKQMHEFTTEEADRPDRLCKLCAAAVAAEEFSALIRKRLGFRGSSYTCPNRARSTKPNGLEVCCAAVDGEWAIDRKNHPPEGSPYRCTGCDYMISGLLASEQQLHPEPEPQVPAAVKTEAPLVELVEESPAETPQVEPVAIPGYVAKDILVVCTEFAGCAAALEAKDIEIGLGKAGEMIGRAITAAPLDLPRDRNGALQVADVKKTVAAFARVVLEELEGGAS